MCASLSGSSRTTALERERLKHGGGDGVTGARRRCRPAPAPGGPPAGAPVGMMKSRWRTSANPQTAPTKATTAPMSIRWFSVAENRLVGVEQRLAGRGTGWTAARRARRRPPSPPGARPRRDAGPRCRRPTCSRRPWCAPTIWLWNTAPSTAMPVAMPTWRNVLLAPEAMPLRWGCTTETAPEARTGLTMPMPSRQTRKPGRRTVQVEFGLVVPMRRSPPVTKSIPMPNRRRELHAARSGARRRRHEEDDQRHGEEADAAASGP